MFDTHCHLDVAEFDADRTSVLDRANQAGVSGILIPAIDASSFAAIARLCECHDGLYAAYGLHPIYQTTHLPAHLQQLRTALMQCSGRAKARAVGEFGLDFYDGAPDVNLQQEYFEAQLGIARDFDLPVVLHARRAVEAVSQGLKKFNIQKGIIHSFSGSLQQAEQLIARGMTLGFGGPITYARAHRLHELIRKLPIEAVVLETDAPDQPLCGFQGKRNDPDQLPRVLQQVANLRGQSVGEIEAITDANARRVFGLTSNTFKP
jgi:TatD DNase family protein